MAPADSDQRREALERLAWRPSLFQDLRKDFPDTVPSLDNLQFSLVKMGFTQEAAEKAAKSYLATMNLAMGIADSYTAPDEAGDEADEQETPASRVVQPPKGKVKLMEGERELTTGLLAKEASFRLIVSGQVGVKEIERLIQKLELDKEILADQSDTE
jgi:hypothetical protein